MHYGISVAPTSYGMSLFPSATYSEGNQIFRPKYDDQASIYNDLLEKLKWASQNIDTDPAEDVLDYGNEETLFGNDMFMWEKLANSMLLRYGMRISNVDQAKARSYVEYAMGRPTFDNTGEMLAWGANWNGIGGNTYWAW